MRAEQSRADWIDVLKGIGIILVVIGHVNTNGFLVQWLYTFHMPLFFCIIRLHIIQIWKEYSISEIFAKAN